MSNKLFKDFGYIKNEKIKKKYKIDLSFIINKINQFNDFIVVKNDKNYKIYNKNCDHAGGKLIKSQDGHNLYCPNHNWVFNPISGKYLNGIKKKKIEYKIKKNKLIFDIDELKPKIKKIFNSQKNITKVKYYNHAFLVIEGKKFKFATDPWAIGPAFNNGWWLQNPTEKDWIKELNSCDFIYLSHNHPDHLNKYTLKKISKNKIFIIPKFEHDSIGGLLKKLNFKNIVYLEINKQYRFAESNLIFCILKSGDFRLDSGIYFSNGNFSSLLDVDTNSINFLRLPEVTMYATSYKGGASGYPLMFENYKMAEKKIIIKKKNNFLKNITLKKIFKLKTKYFLPYASGFHEILKRDENIKKNNKKLSYADYEKALKGKKVKILNINKYKTFAFENNLLISQKLKSKNYYVDKSANQYLKEFKKKNSTIKMKDIKNYFINSDFKDNLVLNIFLTNDNFNKNYEKFSIDFSNKKPVFKNKIINSEKKLITDHTIKFLNLRIRKESFINTIKNKLPWEDILIGFQCRLKRNPNIFNANFWYYFSNIYIHKNEKKYISNCNRCELLNQKIDNLIYHSSQ